jgi:hypothetical protein
MNQLPSEVALICSDALGTVWRIGVGGISESSQSGDPAPPTWVTWYQQAR